MSPVLQALEYGWWIGGAVLIVVAASWRFAVLLERVRSKSLTAKRAAGLLLLTLLLPVLYFVIMVVLHGVALLHGGSMWTGDAALVALGTTAVLMGALAALNLVFWLVARARPA